MNKTLIGIALFSLATPYAVGWQQNFCMYRQMVVLHQQQPCA